MKPTSIDCWVTHACWRAKLPLMSDAKTQGNTMIDLRPHEPDVHSSLCIDAVSLQPEFAYLHCERTKPRVTAVPTSTLIWGTCSGLQEHHTQPQNQRASESVCLTMKGTNNCMGRQWDVATCFILIPCTRALEKRVFLKSELGVGKVFCLLHRTAKHKL